MLNRLVLYIEWAIKCLRNSIIIIKEKTQKIKFQANFLRWSKLSKNLAIEIY